MLLVLNLANAAHEIEQQPGLAGTRFRILLFETLEEVFDWHTEFARKLIKPAGRNAVDAVLVVTDLLIPQADQLTELSLVQAANRQLGGARGGQLADLALFPELANRLGKANRVGPARGAISMSTRLARVTRDPFALIGDASGGLVAQINSGLAVLQDLVGDIDRLRHFVLDGHQVRQLGRRFGRIRVNSMHPGTIDTDMGDQVLGRAARLLWRRRQPRRPSSRYRTQLRSDLERRYGRYAHRSVW
jgi:hypothetical protein